MEVSKKIIKILIMPMLFCLMLIWPSSRSQAAVRTMPDGMQFDPSFYAATYSDVYNAFGMNETLLYQHYLLCGIKEKRLPYAGYEYKESDSSNSGSGSTILTMPDGNLFDPVFYANKYPDVVKVYGALPANLYLHYIYFGIAEGRIPYEGYSAKDIKLTFSTIGAIAEPANEGEFVNAIRQAGKYRITNLKILSRWHGKLSAEAMTQLANGQLAYMKTYYGVKKMTFDVPKMYGDVSEPIIEMNLTFKF